MRVGLGCERCWPFGGKARRRDGSVAKRWRLVVAGGVVFKIKKEKRLTKITALCITRIPARQKVGADYNKYLPAYLH